jgi:hypothetical protein
LWSQGIIAVILLLTAGVQVVQWQARKLANED